MSISKTYFTAANQADNAAEVLSFLLNNEGTRYFFSMVNDNGNIVCKAEQNGPDALVLAFDGTTKSSITLKNGVTLTQGVATSYFRLGIKTSNGIVLVAHSDAALFITETNKFELAFAWMVQTGTYAFKYYFGDYVRGRSFTQHTQSGYMEDVKEEMTVPAGITTFVEVAFDNGTYCRNLFITPFTSVQGRICELESDGVKYAYDGVLALKE